MIVRIGRIGGVIRIPDPHLGETAIEDVRAMTRAVHPAVHRSRRGAIARRHIFAPCQPVLASGIDACARVGPFRAGV